MALSSTFVVHVDKPAETLLSEYFAEMRIWLDDHKIAPTDFRLFGGRIVGLEVRFSGPEQAALFEREFGPKEQPTNVARLIFADHSASQASTTATMSGSDQIGATCTKSIGDAAHAVGSTCPKIASVNRC
jgi:hypothetical protein